MGQANGELLLVAKWRNLRWFCRIWQCLQKAAKGPNCWLTQILRPSLVCTFTRRLSFGSTGRCPPGSMKLLLGDFVAGCSLLSTAPSLACNSLAMDYLFAFGGNL